MTKIAESFGGDQESEQSIQVGQFCWVGSGMLLILMPFSLWIVFFWTFHLAKKIRIVEIIAFIGDRKGIEMTVKNCQSEANVR